MEVTIHKLHEPEDKIQLKIRRFNIRGNAKMLILSPKMTHFLHFRHNKNFI